MPERARQAILGAAVSLIAAGFLGFLIWLGMAVADIRASQLRTEPAVKSLADSSAQLSQQRVQRNSDRIDHLSNVVEGR